MSERSMSDAEVLDRIAQTYLDDMSYDNPSSALESITMLIQATGREVITGFEDE